MYSFIPQTFIRLLMCAQHWLAVRWGPSHGRALTVPGESEAHSLPLSLGPPAAPTQPRVRCQASRYPIAVDCSWTLPPAPNSSRPTSFIATYRSESLEGFLGILHLG